jgi:hypothetical protein
VAAFDPINFEDGPTVSGLFGSAITAGNSQTSAAIDFGNPAPEGAAYELKIASGSGTVDGTIDIHIKWSNDNTDFADDDKAMFLTSITPTASTTVIEIAVQGIWAQYGKILVDNNQSSGPDVTTSSSIAIKNRQRNS